MRHTLRPLRLFWATLLGAVVGSLPWWASADETATRARDRSDMFWLSNCMFFAELVPTNPAMFQAMITKWSARERQILVNGYRTIPYLRQFTTLFPTNIAFRYFSREAMKPHLWTMQTGLYSRHILRMEVLFRVDGTWTNITSYQPPSLSVITYDDHWPNSRGPWELSRRAFTSTDWTNLVSARGDLAVIGFKGSTNIPIEGFERIWMNLMQ